MSQKGLFQGMSHELESISHPVFRMHKHMTAHPNAIITVMFCLYLFFIFSILILLVRIVFVSSFCRPRKIIGIILVA